MSVGRPSRTLLFATGVGLLAPAIALSLSWGELLIGWPWVPLWAVAVAACSLLGLRAEAFPVRVTWAYWGVLALFFLLFWRMPSLWRELPPHFNVRLVATTFLLGPVVASSGLAVSTAGVRSGIRSRAPAAWLSSAALWLVCAVFLLFLLIAAPRWVALAF